MIYLYKGDYSKALSNPSITVESIRNDYTSIFKVESVEDGYLINGEHLIDFSNSEVVLTDKITFKGRNFVTEYTIDSSDIRVEMIVFSDESKITIYKNNQIVAENVNIGDYTHFGILELQDTSYEYDYRTKLEITEGNDALYKAFDLLRRSAF